MSCNIDKLIIFTLFFSSSILTLIISSPIPNPSPYDNFIKFLSDNNCSMPKEIKLPFSNLSEPLDECRSSILKEDDEANLLCTEVFDVLKNITCEKYNESLPVIESEQLSENVCHDFESLKGIIPKRENYLSERLSDKLICKLVCSAEKHEQLCTTLLWSYNTLLRIQHVLSSEPQIQGNTNQDKETLSDKDANEAQIQENQGDGINEGSSEKVAAAKKSSSEDVEPEVNSQDVKKTIKSEVDDDLHKNQEASPVSNPNQTDQVTDSSKVSNGEISSQRIVNKVTLNPKSTGGAVNQTTSNIKNVSPTTLQNEAQPEIQKLSPEASENNIKQAESKDLAKLNPQSEHLDDTENKINVDENLPKKVANTNVPEASSGDNNLSNTSEIKDIVKNKTASSLSNNGNDKDNVNSNAGSKTSEKLPESVVPGIENNDNELKNNFPEEDKSKAKQADTENKEIKETEKQKQTDYEGPNEVLPDNDSKLPESATQLALPDEDIEHQEDKDPDQYNDNENEGDYAKPEYDNSFNLPVKNKEPEVKNPVPAIPNKFPNDFDGNLNGRNNIGRISEEIAMIAPFPEQEDSHFFFYFLSIVLIIMAGYLIFHNKQKIIALIVEGRHERRRRSHGAGYKKLETK